MMTPVLKISETYLIASDNNTNDYLINMRSDINTLSLIKDFIVLSSNVFKDILEMRSLIFLRPLVDCQTYQ